ncbi:maleate isomerase [Aliiruegeria haliotis]|uniref:Maleate isomerase n=1 Tax=Aliiruegeria haliotis TaxID=1280846 RepID=A0A2T0RUT9_9RHOB|nr:Asp/Glu racemase [Aliiruegeria haliotis]PRY24892.1 maleate isomerase [Aliiruegeria haliotis]
MKLQFETDAGIGARATLGLIVLQADETVEPEFARMMALDGVALYHSRIPMVAEIATDTLARMEAALPDAARLLPGAPDFAVIGYACTSAATVIGSDRVALAIRSVFPGAQVTDPLAALIAAGRQLGLRRLGFVTPYVPDVSVRMRAKLEEAGFAIAGFGSFEEADDRIVGRITEPSIVAAAEQVASQASCDGLVIACTNLRCLAVIPEIEARIGMPVLSSNLALGWHMLKLSGLKGSFPTAGRLFASA